MYKYDLWSGAITTPAELAKVFTWRFRQYVLGIHPVDSNSYYVCVELVSGQFLNIKANQEIEYIGSGKWHVMNNKDPQL